MAGPLADDPADVALDAPEILASGYRDYRRYRLALRYAGQEPLVQRRDILVSSPVIAVLPVDPVRREVILIRQFRLAAHLANGRGEMIEIVAGSVEAGEAPAAAARRECREEVGIAPDTLKPLFSFMTSPGITDETIELFVAAVDAARLPALAGAEGEGERIEVLRVPFDDVPALLDGGRVHNGPLILALQWLLLNRDRIDAVFAHAVTQT